MIGRSIQTQAHLAFRFFIVSAVVFCAAFGLAALLIRNDHTPVAAAQLLMPRAFWISSALLLFGSLALHLSLHDVRIERQMPFRQWMLTALVAGTLFVAVQSYGLWSLMQNQNPMAVPTDVNSFVFVFAALHGMHFVVAMLFLVFVTLRALADRYDHEYYLGVMVCAYFWHALGVIWICILAVFAIAASSAVA